MSQRTDFTDVPPPVHRQRLVWRGLVGLQLIVVLAIIGSLAAILVVGAGSVFVQRSP